jgi:HAD superfamily hydrolase (TIGR01509 family)
VEVKAVVFDMDGLMLDTEPLYKVSWQNAANRLGYHISNELFFTLLGKNNSDSERIVLEALGQDFPIDEFKGLWPEIWRDLVLSNGIKPKEGLYEFLDFLDLRSIPFGVATSSDEMDAHLSLKSVNIIERLKFIITGDKIDNGKPAPDIYLEAAKILAVEPAFCIALEDSSSGAKAAISAGMTTIVIPDLVKPTEEIAASAFAVLSSLAEAKTMVENLLMDRRFA